MKKNEIRWLPADQVSAIRSFISNKEDLIKNDSFNKVLRDDIFRLLERQDCVVLYYPKDEEDNNGFHVEYPICGELKHFIYINTAQLKETQIFAAAHELGHTWKIVEYMNMSGFTGNDDWEERIVNRFAAELLMPEEEFRIFARREIVAEKTKHPQEQMSTVSVIRTITAIMNEFLTPFKSVVYRLNELRVVADDVSVVLLDLYDEGIYRDYSRIVAKEQGYSRLYQPPDKLKYIYGLKELLDKARDERAMPEKWLASMYALFDFEYQRQDIALDSFLPDGISIFEGGDADAEDRGY